MNTYTVLLKDGTVGKITSVNPPFTGYEMTVTLSDENGNPIEVTGVVEEILDKKAPWE